MATLTDRPEGEDHEHPDAVERQNITVGELEDVRPEAWSRAAGEWVDLAAAATEARDHVQNVLLKLPFVWAGPAAMMARVQLSVLHDELTIAHRESKAAAATLEAAKSGFKLARTWLDEAQEMARSKDLTREAQDLAEYERTGKPVKYVQQTGWQGWTAEKDPDWYHAVGSFHYNTVAQVEVVPAPDGEPKTTIRYQTHVYDRYNWDANKATPVPAMGNVSDAQMARLHQSGQAKEYDMGGQSEVRTWNG